MGIPMVSDLESYARLDSNRLLLVIELEYLVHSGHVENNGTDLLPVVCACTAEVVMGDEILACRSNKILLASDLLVAIQGKDDVRDFLCVLWSQNRAAAAISPA
jgi:hypothetical protein